MIGRIIGSYRINQKLASNRLAIVYLASQMSSGAQVIVWWIHSRLAHDRAFRDQFFALAEPARRVIHPNIVQVLEYSRDPENLFFATQFVGGTTLRALLQSQQARGQLLSVQDSLRLTADITGGLARAHQANLLHRHINPDNIFIRQANPTQAILTNFITAGLIDRLPGQQGGFQRNEFPYLAPEMLNGTGATPRSDIYAAGATLYEMLVGRPPIRPQSAQEALQMHQNWRSISRPSQLRAGLPPSFDGLVLRALEKNPTDRYLTAQNFTSALQDPSFNNIVANNHIVAAHSPQTYATADGGEQPPIPSQMPAYDANIAGADPNPQQGGAYLVVTRNNQDAEVVMLNRESFIIGRAEDADLQLQGDLISREHALIRRHSDGRYSITDTDSKNGVWVGSSRLTRMQPRTWLPSEVARIGDYWLKLEMGVPATQYARQQSNAVSPAAVAAPAAGMAAVNRSQRRKETERFDVQLVTSTIQVAPGSQAALIFEIVNYGSEDEFIVELSGWPDNWFTLPSSDVRLGAGLRSIVQILLHPERGEAQRIDESHLTLTVRSRAALNKPDAPDEYIVQPVDVHMLPVHNLNVRLQPSRIQADQVAYAYIINEGNQPDDVTISGTDSNGNLQIIIDRPQLTVNPGQPERVAIRAQRLSSQFEGFNRSNPIMIEVRSVRPGAPAVTEVLEYRSSLGIPQWVLALATAAILGLIMLTLGGILLAAALSSNSNAGDEVAALTEDGLAPDEDFDNDGLINSREIELGTNPEVADSDNDNLSDGEEANVHSTNPLNRDSDNDNLTDGQEINLGTNPNNPDTDGDSIPDGADNLPLFTPLPTPDVVATEGAVQQTAVVLTEQAATATPTPTPILPVVSVNDPAPVQEGDVLNNTFITFVVSLDRPNPGPNPVTVEFSIVPDTAQANSDYLNTPSTQSPLAFSVNEQSKFVRIPVVSDTSVDDDVSGEIFTMVLANPSSATLGKSTGVATINDDDINASFPTVSIADASADCDQTQLSYAITTTGAFTSPITFPLQVLGDTNLLSGAAPTEITVSGNTSISLPLTGDCNNGGGTIDVIVVSRPGVVLAKSTGTGTIVDTRQDIRITVRDQTQLEGNAVSTFQFPVTFAPSPNDPLAISVDYAVSALSATTIEGDCGGVTPCNCATALGTQPDADFVATDGTLMPGGSITIEICGDTLNEPDEQLQVTLSNAVGGTIDQATANLTINNDDVAPVYTIGIEAGSLALAVDEDGGVNPTITVQLLDGASMPTTNMGTSPITFDFTTVNGTASSTSGTIDFIATSGSRTFLQGDGTATIQVALNNDILPEPDESFTVVISNPSGATINPTADTATITITDADQHQLVFSSPVTFDEDLDGIVEVDVSLLVPNPFASAIVVSYSFSTTGLTNPATNGVDFVGSSGTLNFSPGQQVLPISLTIISDTDGEGTENANILLSVTTFQAEFANCTGSPCAVNMQITD